MSAPILHSSPSSPNKIWLAFDGWSGPQAGVAGSIVRDTPPFAQPGWVPQIHGLVAANWATVNADITTQKPTSGKYVTCAIGGSWRDWSEEQQSGLTFSPALVGWNFGALTNYVFPLDGELTTPQQVANCICHECGHMFGLYHQWLSGAIRPYRIMGDFFSEPATWGSGTNENGQPQDDLAVLLGILGANPNPPPPSPQPTPTGPTAPRVSLSLIGDPATGPYSIKAEVSGFDVVPSACAWGLDGSYAGTGDGPAPFDFLRGYDGVQNPFKPLGAGPHTIECMVGGARAAISFFEGPQVPPPPQRQPRRMQTIENNAVTNWIEAL